MIVFVRLPVSKYSINIDSFNENINFCSFLIETQHESIAIAKILLHLHRIHESGGFSSNNWAGTDLLWFDLSLFPDSTIKQLTSLHTRWSEDWKICIKLIYSIDGSPCEDCLHKLYWVCSKMYNIFSGNTFDLNYTHWLSLFVLDFYIGISKNQNFYQFLVEFFNNTYWILV